MSFNKFIKTKRKEVEALKKAAPLSNLKQRLKTSPETSDFLKPFKNFTIIAEIKKASPSEGSIDENADIIKIAKQYEKAGAGVISVLTDKKFFHGDISYLSKVRKNVSLPILRKDFIIDKYQIYESKAYGADAILLIVKALSREKLEKLIDLTYKLKMQPFLEIHDEEDLNKIKDLKIKVIGVNNRNLNTLKTDLLVVENLIKKIPKDKIIISESGINNKEDVKRVKKAGVNGILTGTILMKSKDKIKTIKDLLSV